MSWINLKNRIGTILRVALFCLCCAATLATFSSVTKGLSTAWNQHWMLIISIVITYGLTLVFTKWERLKLKDVGVVAHKATLKKAAIGFGIGLLMTLLQPLLVFLLGHYKATIVPDISFHTIIFYLTLYLLVAMREELAFRSYPLFSLNNKFGLWVAQVIILVVFVVEHVAGGMTWIQAFLGAGTGALLFGFAALRTNGIALPIGLHAAWNFGQWCFGFKNETGILRGVIDVGFESIVERNAWISYLLIMATAIILFYFHKHQRQIYQ